MDIFCLVFSGDTDTVVPVTSTRLSIKELKLPIATPWYPWLNGDEVISVINFTYKSPEDIDFYVQKCSDSMHSFSSKMVQVGDIL